MSQPPNASSNSCGNSCSLPAWVSSGVLGLVIGAGGMLLGVSAMYPDFAGAKASPDVSAAAPATPRPMPAMGGMMGGGGGGGGGGAGGKRALTSLVGKLELLSRPELNLRIELDAEQSKAIAAKLAEMEKTESMSADDAQANVDSIEAILKDEQKNALATIGLPFGRGGGGGGGRGGAGGGPPGGGGMMGGGAANPNENPFTQEVNQKRLTDLLARLGPATAEATEKSN